MNGCPWSWGAAGAVERKRPQAGGCGILSNSAKMIKKKKKKSLHSVYLEWLLLFL